MRGWAAFAALCGLAASASRPARWPSPASVAPLELRPTWALLPRVALAALLTALLSPLLLWGLRRLDAALGQQASELAP